MIDVKSCSADDIFRVFTACKGDAPTLILDVRPLKDFSKQHIVHAFCVRVSANGAALLDYSKASYDRNWSDSCWWDTHCILYGPEGLRKDHPVAAYLAKEGHARSVSVFKGGFQAFAARYPFLTTAGVRTQRDRDYPSQIEDYLYLGNWGHAAAQDRLAELNVKSVITIHNNPERLQPPPGVKHMQIEMADVDTEDIGPWLQPTHEFIESARAGGHGETYNLLCAWCSSCALALLAVSNERLIYQFDSVQCSCFGALWGGRFPFRHHLHRPLNAPPCLGCSLCSGARQVPAKHRPTQRRILACTVLPGISGAHFWQKRPKRL